MNERRIMQGQVYMVAIDEDAIGSEQKCPRPCIILSLNSINRNRDNVIIAPITSSIKKHMVQHYTIFKEDYDWLVYDQNTILLECLRDVSKFRVGRKLGRVNKADLANILKLINFNFIKFDVDKSSFQ